MKPVLNGLILDAGAHMTPSRGSCIMEIAAIALDHTLYGFSDLPQCTATGIAYVAQTMWDNVHGNYEECRKEYLAMIVQYLPRLMRAKRTHNRGVNVRVALAACQFMDRSDSPDMACIIDAIKQWLEDGNCFTLGKTVAQIRGREGFGSPATLEELALSTALSAAEQIVSGRVDPSQDYVASVGQIFYSKMHTVHDEWVKTYDFGDDCPDFLDYLLDAHDKALAEEGEAIWEPEDWEDHAIAFVDQLVAECKAELAEAVV